MDMSRLKEIGNMVSGNDSLNRAIVPTRVLQFDSDFACYETADLEIPVSENFPKLLDYLHHKRAMVGAALINCFLTLGEKSGRELVATVKPYQENRDPNVPIKARVRELRLMLSNYSDKNIKVTSSGLFEADDLMCREQNKFIRAGRVNDSIIMSGDKDLWMVQGWHADPKSGRMYKVEGFGKTEYRDVGNKNPKLVGEGTNWFWHQMIMGDKADNIPGLERISNKDMDHYLPLKSGKPRKDGSCACGEAKAVEVLNGVKSEKVAANRTFMLYYNYYGVQAKARFLEQAYLLWMQRTENLWDVLEYLRDCGLKATPTEEQLQAVAKFAAKVKQEKETCSF